MLYFLNIEISNLNEYLQRCPSDASSHFVSSNERTCSFTDTTWSSQAFLEISDGHLFRREFLFWIGNTNTITQQAPPPPNKIIKKENPQCGLLVFWIAQER
ncbi:hypothetical protein CEXT_241881 [Caerostris extrusa]|uniref:Uncharacterized protein n=1 Tax=Caerostris extrusa TaxID=172846 RepID=A0AAV4SWY5_CAEEX|nr:hypothetical protein CEXT_241881 [Caerostris extrusa]